MTNVLEWLEKRAQEMPDKVAFADEHDEVSFLDLMRRARSVGSYLAGIVDERSPIACYMEKSTQTLAAMLGAVYARCYYSIIDVRQPASRARAIVDKLSAPVVLADAKNFDAAWEAFDGYLVICLEDIVDTRADSSLLAKRRAASLDTDPLYINFTSGSTGIPKGVAVSHRRSPRFSTSRKTTC